MKAKVGLKTKSGVEISGEFVSVNKYNIHLRIYDMDGATMNSISHLDFADISVYTNFVSVIIELKNVEHYTIY